MTPISNPVATMKMRLAGGPGRTESGAVILHALFSFRDLTGEDVMVNQTAGVGFKPGARPPLSKTMTRHNGLVFYSLAAVSLLECVAPLQAHRMGAVFGPDSTAHRYLEQQWWPAKAEHGRRARRYVEALWPEFDWQEACAAFHETHRRLHRPTGRGPRHTIAALWLCATAAQTAAFYRALAGYVEDPDLRDMIDEFSRDEAGFFSAFRTLFQWYARTDPIGAVRTYRVIAGSAEQARDGAVRLAFGTVGAHWCGVAPFPAMSYQDALKRLFQIACRNLAPGIVERVLFRGWGRPPQAGDVPGIAPPREVRPAVTGMRRVAAFG
jgi:hypothetical protein